MTTDRFNIDDFQKRMQDKLRTPPAAAPGPRLPQISPARRRGALASLRRNRRLSPTANLGGVRSV